MTYTELYNAAHKADIAFTTAIHAAFGKRASRWTIARKQFTPAVRAAYHAKVAADNALHLWFELERMAVRESNHS